MRVEDMSSHDDAWTGICRRRSSGGGSSASSTVSSERGDCIPSAHSPRPTPLTPSTKYTAVFSFGASCDRSINFITSLALQPERSKSPPRQWATAPFCHGGMRSSTPLDDATAPPGRWARRVERHHGHPPHCQHRALCQAGQSNCLGVESASLGHETSRLR